MHPAKYARLEKEAHPERYCHDKKCLWNVKRSGPCQKHGTPVVKVPVCAECGIELGDYHGKGAQAKDSNRCVECHVDSQRIDPSIDDDYVVIMSRGIE